MKLQNRNIQTSIQGGMESCDTKQCEQKHFLYTSISNAQLYGNKSNYFGYLEDRKVWEISKKQWKNSLHLMFQHLVAFLS